MNGAVGLSTAVLAGAFHLPVGMVHGARRCRLNMFCNAAPLSIMLAVMLLVEAEEACPWTRLGVSWCVSKKKYPSFR
jgi:hypothetical protein